jgi:DNA-binding NarL/FixJ family response regulator
MPELYAPIRVMIADDHQIFREGVFGLFKKQEYIDIVGQAGNGRELLELAEKLNPDVVLTDIKMPVMDGIEATAVLKRKQPDVKVIALSMFNDDHLVLDMIEAGAKGYLLKNAHKNDILEAIKAVYNHDMYYCKETSDKLIQLMAKSKSKIWEDHDKPAVFNHKEKEVIRYICMGLSNKEISDDLHLSVRTIEGYRNRIYEKMKVKNTAGIVVYAIRHGIYEV